MSAYTGKLTAIIGRRVRAIGARFKRPAQPHPELYGLLTGRSAAAGPVEGHLNKLDASAPRTATGLVPETEHLPPATQVCLPIGPSCC
jgi:hypothetical protein